jgi:hypothetical protein
MATLRTTIVVCDICKDPDKPAQRYYMTLPGHDRTGLDLCADDAEAMESYRAHIEAAAKSKGRTSRRVFKAEDIEKMKTSHDNTARR